MTAIQQSSGGQRLPASASDSTRRLPAKPDSAWRSTVDHMVKPVDGHLESAKTLPAPSALHLAKQHPRFASPAFEAALDAWHKLVLDDHNLVHLARGLKQAFTHNEPLPLSATQKAQRWQSIIPNEDLAKAAADSLIQPVDAALIAGIDLAHALIAFKNACKRPIENPAELAEHVQWFGPHYTALIVGSLEKQQRIHFYHAALQHPDAAPAIMPVALAAEKAQERFGSPLATTPVKTTEVADHLLDIAAAWAPAAGLVRRLLSRGKKREIGTGVRGALCDLPLLLTLQPSPTSKSANPNERLRPELITQLSQNAAKSEQGLVKMLINVAQGFIHNASAKGIDSLIAPNRPFERFVYDTLLPLWSAQMARPTAAGDSINDSKRE